MELAIRVQGLTRRFGERPAVADLDFAVHPGELFGVVGPDGAGKTTLLRMLAAVLRPTGGDAWVAGVSVRRQPEGVKPAIAYMSQRFGLYADLTVMENLSFYADLYRVPRQERAPRLERLFAFSNLGPFRDRLAGQLSGGMKQKLGLSCALIHQPEILLLDEPTFGVDPVSRRDLWLIVHEMVAEGVTAVVSTAYMDEAERFDRLLLLHRGRRLALAAPAELAAGLPGALLEVEVDDPRRAREVLERDPAVARAVLFGDRLHVRVEAAESGAEASRKALSAAGIEARRTAVIPPSLEDAVIERIARAEGEDRHRLSVSREENET